MIETFVFYWAPQPRTLSRNTLDLLQDEHSKTGEPLRVIMHAWGSPATGANPFVSSSYFPLLVLCGKTREDDTGGNHFQSKYRRPFVCVYLI